MEANKLFSIHSNGYNINEVNDYVSFIQTELTKNMKINRDTQGENEKLNDEIKQLRYDNKSINEKNVKLYKDCVAFAKRLKALEIYDNSVDYNKDNEYELNEIKNAYDILYKENQELKEKLYNETFENIENFNNNDTYILNDDLVKNTNPSLHNNDMQNDEFETQEFVQNNSSYPLSSDTSIDAQIPVQNELTQNSHSNKLKPMNLQDYNDSLIVNEDKNENSKNNIKNIKSNKSSDTFLKVVNVVINIVLTLTIILSIISGITYAFVRHPGTTIGGYRTYSVWQNDKDKKLSKNDILIVKKISPSDVKKGNKILVKNNNTRKVLNVSYIKNNDGSIELFSKDIKKNEKQIFTTNIIGNISSTIPNIGIISNYAFDNTYDYIAILSCTLLFCLFIKILLSLKKSKKRKVNFGDYDISDFSLDV